MNLGGIVSQIYNFVELEPIYSKMRKRSRKYLSKLHDLRNAYTIYQINDSSIDILASLVYKFVQIVSQLNLYGYEIIPWKVLKDSAESIEKKIIKAIHQCNGEILRKQVPRRHSF